MICTLVVLLYLVPIGVSLEEIFQHLTKLLIYFLEAFWGDSTKIDPSYPLSSVLFRL